MSSEEIKVLAWAVAGEAAMTQIYCDGKNRSERIQSALEKALDTCKVHPDFREIVKKRAGEMMGGAWAASRANWTRGFPSPPVKTRDQRRLLALKMAPAGIARIVRRPRKKKKKIDTRQGTLPLTKGRTG